MDLARYAGIDEALESCFLAAPHTPWRYFPGRSEPSPELEWTELTFDDSSWEEGPAPFVFGEKAPPAGTHLGTSTAGLTTLYLRHVLDVPEPGAYERLVLEIPIDDGYVCYLNGEEERRMHAGDADERRAFDEPATIERSTDLRPTPTVVLTNKLEAGENVLAIQGLAHPEDAQRLEMHPWVRATWRVTPEGERERLEELRPKVEAAGGKGLVAYLEGRHRQRLGDHQGAIEFFRRAAAHDLNAREPWQRLVECHRMLGSLGELEELLRGPVASGSKARGLLDTWAWLFLAELGHSPLEMPAGATPGRKGFYADACWVADRLRAGERLHVDCGSDVDHEPWTRDRFYAPGSVGRRVVDKPGGEGVPQVSDTVRVTTRSLDELRPAFRVPLPNGAYQLVLHFSEPPGASPTEAPAAFDVCLEGGVALVAYEPGASGAVLEQSFPIVVSDGMLDIDLHPRTPHDPALAGFELEPIEDAQLAQLASSWVEATQRRLPLPLAILADSNQRAGNEDVAFELLEQAQSLPGFRIRDSERLNTWRAARLPELPSLEAAEFIATSGPADIDALIAEVQAREDNDPVLSGYLAGRLYQLEGRVDEALGELEALVGEEVTTPEPYLRMAECLADLELGEEAHGVLERVLELGLERSPEFFSLWIEVQLDWLERDPWELVRELHELGAPDELIVVPTSQHEPQSWHYTTLEPPANIWARSSFDVSGWAAGPGGIGAGHTPIAVARSLWNTDLLFAQRRFHLRSPRLLYPHFTVFADDAAGLYLNGQQVGFVGVTTLNFIPMPARNSSSASSQSALGGVADGGRTSALGATALLAGENALGINGLNTRGPACIDVGIVQPLGELFWISQQLEQHGALRLNCGGAAIQAPGGTAWGEDRFFAWGLPDGPDPEEPAAAIENTDNDELYRSNRWFFDDSRSSWYQIPLPNGSYTLRLHFAELDPSFAEAGSRPFDIDVESNEIVKDFDVVTAAGFATAHVLEAEIAIRDGWLDIFPHHLESRAFLCGLEVLRR